MFYGEDKKEGSEGESMGKMNDIYPIAIEQTKQKVTHNIERYLEVREQLPEFERYIADKKTFIEQIWLDIWINKASNDVPKNEKKSFLHAKGMLTTGIDHKIISKMFRNELKNYRPFNVLEWLNDTFSENPHEWYRRYSKARDTYYKKQKKQQETKHQWIVQTELQKIADHFFEDNTLVIYVYIRDHIAKILADDFKNKPKFNYIDPYMLEDQLEEQGSFDMDDYIKLTDFFEELTGGIHSLIDLGRRHYEYETYYYRYERIVYEYISEFASLKFFEALSENQMLKFEIAFGEKLKLEFLKELLSDDLVELSEACFEEFQEEYLTDLLILAGIPFEEELHKEIFDRDVADRERRKEEELAERARLKAEEERIKEDIFGKAYTPTLGRSMKYVLHIGETNTGKTYQALLKMKEANSEWYLSPLRLLALEVYDKLNADGIPCSLKTGEEEKLTKGATHISSTVEMFHEKEYFDVIDEAQMMADKDRGFSWYQAIMKANAKEVHIIGSRNIKSMLYGLLEEANIELHEYSRETPLEIEQREFSLKYTNKGDALVCFSRRKVLETASALQRSGHSVSVIYGSMPPENRKRQIERFNLGESSVVVSTDAIGMGLNLPIQRIVFLENEKFDGTHRRKLTSQEVKQIAGRAERKGIYNTGKVAFTSDVKEMQKLLDQEDEPVQIFAIAPTASVFERFQKYYRNMGLFFEMWDQFEPPKGTKKSSLSQERDLYGLINDTEIEARFSLMDLYGFLHLPFSGKEPELVRHWLATMKAIAENRELPEPLISTKNLEELELSYKAIGLHLLFLYRLDRRTEAIYWERVQKEISNGVHDHLKGVVVNYQKKCKRCGKILSDDSQFSICEDCHQIGYRNAPKTQKRWR